jgi:protein TonB
MLGIIALHVGAVVLALTMKGPQADPQRESPPMSVLLFAEPEKPRAPDVPVPKMEVTPPQMIVPVVNTELPAPAPTAITVVAAAPPPAPPPTAPAVADADSPISIAQAEWVRMPSPVYPRAAKQARAQGVVHVRALVDATGHAREARVHRSSGFAALDRAACDSVLAALFRPYLHNGMPRSVDVIVPVTFALTQPGGGRDRRQLPSELDVRRENHHTVGGHAKELGSLGTAALHVGE